MSLSPGIGAFAAVAQCTTPALQRNPHEGADFGRKDEIFMGSLFSGETAGKALAPLSAGITVRISFHGVQGAVKAVRSEKKRSVFLCECAGNPFFLQKNGSRTLPKKLPVFRLPLVADGLVFTSKPGILIVRRRPFGHGSFYHAAVKAFRAFRRRGGHTKRPGRAPKKPRRPPMTEERLIRVIGLPKRPVFPVSELISPQSPRQAQF
jgi:hypothetical protein